MKTKAISREISHVQNPALGAALIWRFAVGYVSKSQTSDYPVLQLCFLVLPVLFHRETFELLQKTQARSSIHHFVDKFSQSSISQSDILLGIHGRTEAMRSLTLQSLRIAVTTRIVTIAKTSAKVIPLSHTSPSGVAAGVKPLLANAEKFGGWCSELSLFEISSILKVRF